MGLISRVSSRTYRERGNNPSSTITNNNNSNNNNTQHNLGNTPTSPTSPIANNNSNAQVKTVIKTVKQKRKIKKSGGNPLGKDLKGKSGVEKKLKNLGTSEQNLSSLGSGKNSTITKSTGDLTQALKRTTSNSTPNTPLIPKNKNIVKTLNDRIKSFDEEEDLDFVSRPNTNFSSGIQKDFENIEDRFSKENLVKPSQVRA